MNFLKNLFSHLKQGHQNGLIVFAASCVIVLVLGVNGFLPKTNENHAMERKYLPAENEEQAESAEALPEEESISHYYVNKIESKIKANETEEHVLQLADNTEDRQFVTSGKILSRSARQLSTEEYEIFTRIVEAEVGAETYELKLLVANIILNRVEHRYFPNSIKEVVFEKTGRHYQFSPISNGSYYRVSVKDSTIKAVEEALAGKDNSAGALYFMTRSISTAGNVTWFDTHLTKVGQIGKVEYFK